MSEADGTDTSIHEQLVTTLRKIYDPEIPINIHDLGLIYDLIVAEDRSVRVRMTLTAPNCPMAEEIVRQVETKLRELDAVTAVDVELVWEPPWNPDMMSEAAKLELEFTGHTGPAHLKKGPFSSLTIGRKDVAGRGGAQRRPRDR